MKADLLDNSRCHLGPGLPRCRGLWPHASISVSVYLQFKINIGVVRRQHDAREGSELPTPCHDPCRKEKSLDWMHAGSSPSRGGGPQSHGSLRKKS